MKDVSPEFFDGLQLTLLGVLEGSHDVRGRGVLAEVAQEGPRVGPLGGRAGAPPPGPAPRAPHVRLRARRQRFQQRVRPVLSSSRVHTITFTITFYSFIDGNFIVAFEHPQVDCEQLIRGIGTHCSQFDTSSVKVVSLNVSQTFLLRCPYTVHICQCRH